MSEYLYPLRNVLTIALHLILFLRVSSRIASTAMYNAMGDSRSLFNQLG
jgi:hypothetical protein